MADIPDIAKVAALIGDPTRANMLAALKDDGVLSAAELAQVAGVAPNTASGHLSKLVEAGMLRVDAQGRHRFFALACPQVADVLESLEALAARTEPLYDRRRAATGDVRFARSCYDHLAGRLGVEFAEALERLEFIERTDRGFDLLDKGAHAVTALGVDLNAIKAGRRRLLRACPDWSEGSFHLGGALGALLFRVACEHGWLRRRRGNRALDLTPIGRAAFRDRFGMKC